MCCAVLGVAALAAAGRRSVENGCGCSRCRFEPRTNVIRMTEPAGDCCCSCCCCNCAETDRAVAPSVSCEAVEAFKQAYADRSCGGNRRGCGCRIHLSLKPENHIFGFGASIIRIRDSPSPS